MKGYRKRDWEIFIVSGDSVNAARTVRSILNCEPGVNRARPIITIFADWPEQEFPADLRPFCEYVKQGKPFVITQENNRALRSIWAQGKDAVLIEDDVVLHTPGMISKLSEYAEAFDGRCFLSPGIRGYKYDNVVCEPNPYLTLYREPVHFPIICCYFPVELEFLIGYYDEGYTAYGCDDNDYSLRLYRAGIPMYACPQLVAEHVYGDSVFKARGRDQTASRAYFKRKWGQFPGDPKLR